MQIHIFKGNFFCNIKAKHNHSRDPEKNNFTGSFHNIGGVKSFIIFRVWVPQSCKRPLARRKPCVKSVIFFYYIFTAFFTFCNFIFYINKFNLAIFANFSRYRYAPNNLPGNIPVNNIF